VVGALLNIGQIRRQLSGEAAVRACALSMGSAIVAVALSRMPVLTAAAFVVRGRVVDAAVACSISACSCSAAALGRGPVARAFQASIRRRDLRSKLGWGHLTDAAGVEMALLVSAG